MKKHSTSKNIRLVLATFVIGVNMIMLSCTVTSVLQPSTASPTQSPTPAYEVGSTVISPSDGMNLMFVPAGEFAMGTQDGAEDEKPVHSVYLDSFWIDKTEVTNKMYSSCVKEGACYPPFNTVFYEDPDYVDSPVDYVTWDDANAYCTWVGRRLPTEAEWEKAASWDDAKKEKRIYAWGNTVDCSLANIYTEGESGLDCQGIPVKVGSYPQGASYYGALDMTGNVTEWVADLYSETYYQVSPSSNPRGPQHGTNHVLRGGSFLNQPLEVFTTARQSESFFYSWPTFYDMVGFRCATDDPNKKPGGPSAFLDQWKFLIEREAFIRNELIDGSRRTFSGRT